MNAIDKSTHLVKNICELIDTRISEHFGAIDNGVLNVAPLTPPSLVEYVCKIVAEIKFRECLDILSLYMKFRPDLEIRSGKNGGIYRINDPKANMSTVECALRNYNDVKSCAPAIIDNAFELAKQTSIIPSTIRLNVQDLAQTIADKLKIKKYSAYHCLKEYIQNERQDLVIDLGRYGGLRKI